MADFILETGAMILCPHGGQVSIAPSNSRVLLGGQPALTLDDVALVVGCLNQLATPAGPVPQPCLSLRWGQASSRVLINGRPALLRSSQGLCQSAGQTPQGTATIGLAQTRVRGS